MLHTDLKAAEGISTFQTSLLSVAAMLSENCSAYCSTSTMLQSYTEMQGDDPNMKVHFSRDKTYTKSLNTKCQKYVNI